MENTSTKPTVDFLAQWLASKNLSKPYAHVVLGSGLALPLPGLEFPGWKFAAEIPFGEVPGVKASTAPGHKAAYRIYSGKKGCVSLQTGRLHGFEGNTPSDVVRPVVAMADLGVGKFILTNAAGSLQAEMQAGSVMLIEDQVNLTGLNPLTGTNNESLGPRFPDMSQIYSPTINGALKKNLEAQSVPTYSGIYIGVNGPSFETPAEIKLFAKWGMGAVGMSTVLEAIALKYRGKEIGGLSFLANMAAGLGEKATETLSGDEVLEEGLKRSPLILKAIFQTLEQI